MYGTKSANVLRQSEELSSVDTGPRERSRHAGGLRIAARSVTEGGLQTSVGAQAAFECVLDVLLGTDPAKGPLAGTQGSKLDRIAVARSRYEAGMKLRRLFVDAGLVGVHAFDMNGGRGQSAEISDRQALARRNYNDLMRRLGPLGTMASGPCCFDQMPDNERWLSNIRRALDALCEVVL